MLRKKAFKKAIVFGILSVCLYIALFINIDLVMKYFTKGGYYAVLPTITALIFSYIHGSFTSYVWTALGVVASNQTGTKATGPAQPH